MAQGRETIRVVVADDHTMLRRIVQMACEDRAALELVGEAGDGPQAVDAVLEHRPDVLVLDLALPHFDGFEVARRVKQQAPDTKILILTARDDARALFDSMRADVCWSDAMRSMPSTYFPYGLLLIFAPAALKGCATFSRSRSAVRPAIR